MLIASYERLAFALLPAVTVGGGRRGRFDLAVVTLVTRARTLGTTAQVADERTRATLEYVLGDVLIARPRERARVIRAERVERRLI